jgi:16S rRNA U1498 N3-methylase RsmE
MFNKYKIDQMSQDFQDYDLNNNQKVICILKNIQYINNILEETPEDKINLKNRLNKQLHEHVKYLLEHKYINDIKENKLYKKKIKTIVLITLINLGLWKYKKK